MQVDAGEFINKLRDRLAVKLDTHDYTDQIMGAFDRACVQVLVDEHESHKQELTSGQKAARTRKANRDARLREEIEHDSGAHASPAMVGGQ